MEFRPAPTQTIRVSNDERNAAVHRLQAAFAEGRFDADELEVRLDRAMTAKTRGDLDESLRHLPSVGTGLRLDPEPSEGRDRFVEPTQATVGERLCGSAAHFLGWPTLLLGPALIAAAASSPYVRQHAIEAVNFQITFLGAVIALGMVTAMTLGVAAIGFPFLVLAWFGLTGIGGLAALVGNRFHYPLALRPLKP